MILLLVLLLLLIYLLYYYYQCDCEPNGRLEVGWGKSGVLEHKSGNISETRKDRGTVTTERL